MFIKCGFLCFLGSGRSKQTRCLLLMLSSSAILLLRTAGIPPRSVRYTQKPLKLSCFSQSRVRPV